MNITFRKANSSKEPMTILKTVSKWLNEKSINQWQTYLTGEEDQVITHSVDLKETWLVFDDEKPIATFNLSTHQNEWDIDLWGSREDSAYYLHRVAIIPTYMKKEIGQLILAFVEKTATTNSIPVIRLDCVQSSQKLNTFYQLNGYSIVKTKDEFTLYEKSTRY